MPCLIKEYLSKKRKLKQICAALGIKQSPMHSNSGSQAEFASVFQGACFLNFVLRLIKESGSASCDKGSTSCKFEAGRQIMAGSIVFVTMIHSGYPGPHCDRQSHLPRGDAWTGPGQLCQSLPLEPGAELSARHRPRCWSGPECARGPSLHQPQVAFKCKAVHKA